MVDMKGIVFDIHYVADQCCSVYFISRGGIEVTMTLTDTERANNRYNAKMAEAVKELERRENHLPKRL